MSSRLHKDFIRMKLSDRIRLLDRLDQLDAAAKQEAADEADPTRNEQCWEYRRLDLAVTVDHPAGGSSRFLVCSRNLSAGGIAFLHGGFLYPDSLCRVFLPRFDGQVPEQTGSIVSCRHVEGLVHEVVIKFDVPIEPEMFLQSRQACRSVDVDTVELPDLHGDVLLVDDSESKMILLAHQLESTEVDLTVATDHESVVEALGSKHFDIVLCDLDVHEDAGVELIATVRDNGHDGPVVLVTAEDDATRLRVALDAGVDYMLSKPFDSVELFAKLYRLQENRGAATVRNELLYSSMEDQPGMRDIIAHYIEDAERIGTAIGVATDEKDLKRVRKLCLSVKGNAASVGFAMLSNVAAEAVALLDEETAPSLAMTQVHKLRSMCRSLAMHEVVG